LELRYDRETCHSRDISAQKRWNQEFIAKLAEY